MVIRVLLLLLPMLAGCERDKEKPRPPPCLADDLGDLRADWHTPEQCKDNDVTCRELCTNGNPDACFYVATKNPARS